MLRGAAKLAICLGLTMASITAAAARTLPPPPAGAAVIDPGYTLDVGDKVRIIVFNEPKLTGEYGVTDSGEIAFPLIGNVKVLGKPIETVQEGIRSRLADGYLRDPKVSVEVINYRPFYILGEVNRPGQYPFTKGLTIQQAAAAAGGFTYRANTKRVFIRRSTDATETPVNARGPVALQPGDTIRVGERYF